MAGFAASINLNSEKILTHINTKCYSIAWDLFTSIVRKSPSPNNPGEWAKGLLANQWYPKAKTFSDELGTATSPNGSASLARINAMMGGREFFTKNGRLTLSNNLSYSHRAETLGWPQSDGWSGKVKPYRMVALSLQEVAAKNR